VTKNEKRRKDERNGNTGWEENTNQPKERIMATDKDKPLRSKTPFLKEEFPQREQSNEPLASPFVEWLREQKKTGEIEAESYMYLELFARSLLGTYSPFDPLKDRELLLLPNRISFENYRKYHKLLSESKLEEAKKMLESLSELRPKIPVLSLGLVGETIAKRLRDKETKSIESPQHEAILKPLNDEQEIVAKLKSLSDSLAAVQDSVESLKKENHILKNSLYNIITGADAQEKIQFMSVEIFLDTDDNETAFRVYSAVLDFLTSMDFERSIEFEAVKGSWYKRLVADSTKAMTSDQLVDRLKEAEYAVEVATILKPQSEVDKNQSEALLNILKSVETVPNAAIRIGALLVVKVTSVEGEVSVQACTLSIKELHLLNKKPDLLRKPHEILTALSNEIEDGDPGEATKLII